jgi:hypothetical protein
LTKDKKAPKSCKGCPRWKEVRGQVAVAGVLSKAVEEFTKKLSNEGFQPTVSEFLKLVQIEQDLANELNPPEEIRVRWVDPIAESENSK